MRFVSLIPAVAALFLSGAASSQTWDVYANQENFFSVNFPGTPAVAEMPYKTAKGTDLPARVFTAVSPPGSILSGTYSVAVVDYSSAVDEMNMAVEHAADAIRAKGSVKYDAIENLDQRASRRLTVETPTDRILAEIVYAENNHLYISQAVASLNTPPPANFQASLQILDDNGVPTRRRILLGLPEGSRQPTGAGGLGDEPDKVAALMAGSWRAPSGTCEAAYFKSRMRTTNSRGDEVMLGTITNGGTTIDGMVIVKGSRAGQFLDPITLAPLMLFDPMDEKLTISSIGGAATGWPDVTLEFCPGSRT
jgi:hypothetical protein